MKHILIGILCISGVFACTKNIKSTSNAQQGKEEKPAVVTEELQETPEQQKISESVNFKHKDNSTLMTQGGTASSRKVKLNDEYFLVDKATRIKASAKVFNLSMQESGRIKGTIVIVTADIDSVVQDIGIANKSITEIADDTYRLYLKENIDLYSLYKKLVVNSSIDTVEVEVDYSGKRTLAEF